MSHLRAYTQTLLFVCFSFLVSGQACYNVDFETGDFTGWDAYTGSCCGAPINNPGVVFGRHTMITQSVPDANTNFLLQTMPPSGGGNFVVRLGNDNVNGEAEKLVRSFPVTAGQTLFTFQYALVLQDPPGHTPQEKPKFRVLVKDASGDTIQPANCGIYDVVAGPSTNDFNTYGDVRWKDWSTATIDLSAYVGTTVSIEFMVQDCGKGGHFGYAYLDASCSNLEISHSGFCPGSDSVDLVAPHGFESYFWPSLNDTNQQVTIAKPNVGDTIWVELTSASGCQTEAFHVFMDYPLIPSTILTQDTTICLGDQVLLESTPDTTGGTHLWYGNGSLEGQGQNIQVQPTVTTTYKLYSTNPNGCLDPAGPDSVVIDVMDSLEFELPDDTTLCLPQAFNLQSPKPALYYYWLNQHDDTLSYADTLSIFIDQDTTIRLLIGDGVCTYEDEFIVSFIDPTKNSDSIERRFCAGDSSLNIPAPPGYQNYSWNNGSTGNTTIHNPYDTNELKVYFEHAPGCPDSMRFVFMEKHPVSPNVQITEDTVCIGSSTAILASSPEPSTTYFWFNSQMDFLFFGPTFTFSPTQDTMIHVRADVLTGCRDSTSWDSVWIEVDSTAHFELGPNRFMCEGDIDSLFGPSGFDSYSWSVLGTQVSTDSNFIVNPDTTTQYELTAGKLSCFFTDILRIDVDQSIHNQDSLAFCLNQSSYTLSAPAGYSSYRWISNNSTDTTISFSTLQNGQQEQVLCTKANTCTDTNTFKITAHKASKVNALGDRTLCFGEPLTLSQVAPDSTEAYFWTSLQNGLLSNTETLNYVGQQTDTIVLSIQNVHSCYSQPVLDTIILNVLDEYLIPDQPHRTICYNDTLMYQASSSSGNKTWIYRGNSFVQDTILIAHDGGIDSLTLIVDTLHCADTAVFTFEIFARRAYTIVQEDSVGCESYENQYSIIPNTFSSATWYFENDSIGAGETLIYALDSNDVLQIEVYDENGCFSDSSHKNLAHPLPYIFLGEDIWTCTDEEIYLAPEISEDADILWSTGDATPVLIVQNDGVFTVSVSKNGCTIHDTIVIERELQEFDDRVPNVFTPNGDGINDVLSIDLNLISSYSLTVLNRWGSIVYEGNSPNDFWNGNNKQTGEPLQEGVYFYLFRYLSDCSTKEEEYHGSVHLIRNQ